MNKITFAEEDTRVYLAGTMWCKGEEAYILAQVDRDRYSLISLIDGNRYITPENFGDIQKTLKSFQKVNLPFTVTPNR